MDSILVQFLSDDGKQSGPPLTVPPNISRQQLNLLINKILNNSDPVPYTFRVGENYIDESIEKDLFEKNSFSSESILPIQYIPQAVFRVRSVTRCSSSVSGLFFTCNCKIVNDLWTIRSRGCRVVRSVFV